MTFWPPLLSDPDQGTQGFLDAKKYSATIFFISSSVAVEGSIDRFDAVTGLAFSPMYTAS